MMYKNGWLQQVNIKLPTSRCISINLPVQYTLCTFVCMYVYAWEVSPLHYSHKKNVESDPSASES